MPDKKSWEDSIELVQGDNPIAKVTVRTDNYKNLTEIIVFLKNKGIKAVSFAQVAIPVLSPENHSLLVPTNEMLPHLVKALKAAKKEGLTYSLEDLPLCLMPGEEDHFVLRGTPGIKMQFCHKCDLSPRCGGITKAQLIAQYGTQLLSWQFLFPKDFFSDQDIAFLDEQLLKESTKE
jgi:hypothetical protein